MKRFSLSPLRHTPRALLILSALGLTQPALAQTAPSFEPIVLPASDEAEQAIAGFRVPEGFRVSLWAAEPHLANPVAFAFDDQGRVYVAETFRLHQGVTDTRGHMYWLDDDLACETVEDRVAMYRRWFDDETFVSYGQAPDRVRLVEDTDGDGRADRATVFADGFNDVADGIGAGLLARDGRVWYTCIPDLWLLIDEDGDGQADVEESLSTGYGVHVAFLGHDLHGLTFGPDGKLYFSIGDRGLNVETPEGERLVKPHTGSVLRCDPDGANLEIFATGLRNPQELAFDRYGNLFTVDNNSDGGDQARLVHLVEGGDSGWRIGYQYLNRPEPRGVWNSERLWRPEEDGNEAAYLLPPLANFSDGPSGLAFNPGGAGMPEELDDHFFLADFRGTPGISGIRTFGLDPHGASFWPVDQRPFFWSILATDVDFAPWGGLLVSDWVEGWRLTGKGRLYHLAPKGLEDDPTAAEVARLLAEGFSDRSTEELIELLGHVDQRIRQRAQFALAERGDAALEPLDEALRSDDEMTRLHALWTVAQIGEQEHGRDRALTLLLERAGDSSPHLRAQAVRRLGDLLAGASDHDSSKAIDMLILRLGDVAPRVRMQAAIALGKLGSPNAVAPIAAMLRENADRDPYLRHAGAMGLLGAAREDDLERLAGDASSSVRLATLLVYRRQGDPKVARFLNDPEPRLVVEAARAINDELIEGALTDLAALEVGPLTPEPVVRRVLNANLRLGGSEQAAAVARIAASEQFDESIRVEALTLLGEWAEPRGRDRIVGLWRPIEPRSPAPAVAAFRPIAARLLSEGASSALRQAAARTAGRLELRNASGTLARLVEDPDAPDEARVAGLEALEALGTAELTATARRATAEGGPQLRSEGLRILADRAPDEALPILDAVLEEGSTRERQRAVATLAGMGTEAADRVLADWLDRLIAGQAPAELSLDLLEAARERGTPELTARLERFEAARDASDPLAAYRECLNGGNAFAGRTIFFEKTEAQCLRCHKIDGEGGEVGPDLSTIGRENERSYLLEAIVQPNAQIAEGFETLIVATTDGRILSGIVKEETDKALTLIDAEGQYLVLPKAEIEETTRGASAMPEDLLDQLSKREIRDLVEFLSWQGKRGRFRASAEHGAEEGER